MSTSAISSRRFTSAFSIGLGAAIVSRL